MYVCSLSDCSLIQLTDNRGPLAPHWDYIAALVLCSRGVQNEKKNDMHLHSADLLFFSTVKSCKSAVNFLQLNGIPAVTDQSIAETTECMKILGPVHPSMTPIVILESLISESSLSHVQNIYDLIEFLQNLNIRTKSFLGSLWINHAVKKNIYFVSLLGLEV